MKEYTVVLPDGSIYTIKGEKLSYDTNGAFILIEDLIGRNLAVITAAPGVIVYTNDENKEGH